MDEQTDRDETLAAIARVRRHLAEQWISDSCRDHQVMFCASCQMVDLDRRLEMLESEVAGLIYSSAAPSDYMHKAGTEEGN